MDEKLYRKLGQLTKEKTVWKQNIPYIASLLENRSPKITAKAMWLLGEMGLMYPQEIAPYTKSIASFIVSENDLLRERSANALGRIGRADYNLVAPYLKELFILAKDESPNVRLSFIWASENIATNAPTVYEGHLSTFAELLNDENERVWIEAPEMFRVLGKRKPEFVRPYLEKLDHIATHDEVRVVRIHAKGAIKATLSKVTKEPELRRRVLKRKKCKIDQQSDKSEVAEVVKNMKRYIALLRGINISGKNKVPMAELKQGFERLDYTEVKTYLNSGNVIFSSDETDAIKLTSQIEKMIKSQFSLDIPVFVISKEGLEDILHHAPGWWGDESKEIYDNLIFIMPPATFKDVYSEVGEPKEGLEKIKEYKETVFWSFSRKDYQKTNWWSKTASENISSKLTIRTANTVRKIVGI